MATDNIHSIGVVNRFTGPPYISYIYNKQCWVISIINNVGSVISPLFLQPIRTPCHVKMIFWGPSNKFMRRETKKYQTSTGQCPVLRMTFHKLFPHFLKTIIFVWKTLYFFRSPKCYRDRTYSLYHCRLLSNNLTKDINHWDIYIISNISFRLKYIKTKTNHIGKKKVSY